MTHRVQLEFDENDQAFTATMFHNGEASALQSPKIQTPDGRQVAALDDLFTAIRHAIGARIFPRDTFRFEHQNVSNGVKHVVAGFADGTPLTP